MHITLYDFNVTYRVPSFAFKAYSKATNIMNVVVSSDDLVREDWKIYS